MDLLVGCLSLTLVPSLIPLQQMDTRRRSHSDGRTKMTFVQPTRVLSYRVAIAH